jgi:hypothetical protein
MSTAEDRELISQVATLDGSVQNLTGELGEVRHWKTRVFKAGVVAVVIGLLAITGAGAAFWQINGQRISACQQANQTRSDAAGIWHYLVAITTPPGRSLPVAKQRQISELLTRVDTVYRPRACHGIFG